MNRLKISDCVEAAGVELDLRRMQLPRNLAARYDTLLQYAVGEMNRIEAGEHVNVDEDRPVGHYWLRNPELAPEKFRKAIEEARKRIDEFCKKQFSGRFDQILWIGIGGSGLGPQMLYDVLRKPDTLPMFFFDNTDPAGFERTRCEIGGKAELERTLTVVVSKSGKTPETANGMRVAKETYTDVIGVGAFEKRAVAITKPDSLLDRLADGKDPEGNRTGEPAWLNRFPIWDWVGGRTSLFSPVGMLPARLLGFSVDALLQGAQEMDNATRGGDYGTNPALRLAASWYYAVEERGLRNMVVLPYCDRLVTFSRYLQQLVMESLGKAGHGITVFGNKGSTDQHSYIQQLREGRADFFATFIRVLDPEVDFALPDGVTASDYLAAFQEGTAQALSEAGRPSMRLTVQKLNEGTLGALVALFERAVGFYAAMLGINGYHQPGVEAGKRAADALLDLQRDLVGKLPPGGPAKSVRELAETVHRPPDVVYDILNRLCICGRYGLVRKAAGAKSLGDVRFAR